MKCPFCEKELDHVIMRAVEYQRHHLVLENDQWNWLRDEEVDAENICLECPNCHWDMQFTSVGFDPNSIVW